MRSSLFCRCYGLGDHRLAGVEVRGSLGGLFGGGGIRNLDGVGLLRCVADGLWVIGCGGLLYFLQGLDCWWLLFGWGVERRLSLFLLVVFGFCLRFED